MNFKCPACGFNKFNKNDNFLICDFCQSSFEESYFEQIQNENEKFISNFIKNNNNDEKIYDFLSNLNEKAEIIFNDNQKIKKFLLENNPIHSKAKISNDVMNNMKTLKTSIESANDYEDFVICSAIIRQGIEKELKESFKIPFDKDYYVNTEEEWNNIKQKYEEIMSNSKKYDIEKSIIYVRNQKKYSLDPKFRFIYAGIIKDNEVLKTEKQINKAYDIWDITNLFIHFSKNNVKEIENIVKKYFKNNQSLSIGDIKSFFMNNICFLEQQKLLIKI